MEKNNRYYLSLFWLMLPLLAYCGKTIPVEELSKAKYDISRAEAVRADKYAPDAFNEARNALLAAHDAVEKEDMGLAKTKAEEASAKAKEAYLVAAPQLAQETRKEATAAIRNAEDLNSEVFAPVEFQNAKNALAAGDDRLSQQDYVEAFRKFEEAREEANKASAISEGQIDGMRRQLAQVEEKIREAENLGAAQHAPDSLRKAQESAQLARQHLTEKRLKLASADLSKANESADQAIKIARKEWARRKYVEAEAAVQAAESNMIKLRAVAERQENKKVLESSAQAQEALTAAEETLEAAKESLAKAEKEYRAENYVLSYNHSEEAIRLARIVNEQIPNVELAFVQARQETKTETTDKPQDVGKKEKGGEVREGWKKYKVRLIPHRRDCLWRIAEYKFIYGNPFLWPKIYRANKHQIKNPDLIYPGQIFDIPPRDWPEKGGAQAEEKQVEKKGPEKSKSKGKEKKTEPKVTEESSNFETVDEYQRPVIPEGEYEEE
ncbi:MAG: DUF4398 domain-containing protein [Leptospiraceae bacterium]|nr:DUF4398 domain-containing protein [Leptospiraceae bacterium]